MNSWNLSNKQLKERGAENTAKEICQQPDAWEETLRLLEDEKEEIDAFVKPLLAKRELRIIFTGAGTSAYVGDIIAPYLREKIGKDAWAIATTDIVATPKQYLLAHKPTVLISFARSGDSPESIGAFDLAEQLIDEIYHIVITCNPKGALVDRAKKKSGHTLVLYMPKNTNDLGFAMTSSFTCMLLSGLMVFDMDNFSKNAVLVRKIAACGRQILQDGNEADNLGKSGFERITFLGSGALYGLARETCLKVLELTAGKIAAVSESVMGFRHGPKSIINDRTLVVMLLSSQAYTHAYEMDFLRELYHDAGAFKVMTMSSAPDKEAAELADYSLVVDKEAGEPWGEDAYMALAYVLFDHIFALSASITVGIAPDTPCPSGNVNRVVKGVTLHPFKN